MDILNVFSNTKGFLAEDAFNPGNVLEGYIAVNKNDYGSMIITSINGEKTEQIIHTTPKISYPFDRNGRWIMPPAKSVETYEKLDGTNIFMYRYTYNGETYVSYKTRLMPFVENSYFGDFYDMWVKMLDKYPSITTLFDWDIRVHDNTNLWDVTGYSFELYGALNRHLIQYEVPLDTKLLFAMIDDSVIPLSELGDIDVPMAEMTGALGKSEYFEASYKEVQEDMDNDLEKVEDDNNEYFYGAEGEIWYVELEVSGYQMFKCKPETIESIHWENSSPLIHENSIRTTIYNAAESGDITYYTVSSLLLEEFSQIKVTQSETRIKKIMYEVIADLEMRRSVREVIKDLEIDLKTTELPDVMRKLAPTFRGHNMSKVYNTARQIKEIML